MKYRHRSASPLLAVAFASSLSFTLPGHAQTEDCQDTSEGRVCRLVQEIRLGVVVPIEGQKQRGLVIINNGCSGTLLNRYWVLTARHCVTTTGRLEDPLRPPEQNKVTASWALDRVGHVSRVQEMPDRSTDMVMLYLGTADLGAVNVQTIWTTTVSGGGDSTLLSGRLTTDIRVTEYGQGLNT